MKSVFDNVMKSMLVVLVVMSVYAGGKIIRDVPAMSAAMANASIIK